MVKQLYKFVFLGYNSEKELKLKGKTKMWHFTADWHLNHNNIIKYCERPFMSVEEKGLFDLIKKGSIPQRDLKISDASTKLMTDTIIDNTNAVVRHDDTLVIIGDFCSLGRQARFNVAKAYRDRINCKNVYLVIGNHDNREILSPLFTAVYDHFKWNVDGQLIFTDHYPGRSWDGAHHGAWMLYGHVHDLFNPEDNGDLMPYDKKMLAEGFESVLNRYLVSSGNNQLLIQDLLAVAASLKGIDLTVDVGVDNRIRGLNVPFGTPWSMDDLRTYMKPKKSRWEARNEVFKSFVSVQH